MKPRNHTSIYTTCNIMGLGAVVFVSVSFYVLGTRFYESYKSGAVKFQYHSNVFYGHEAAVMYASFTVVLVALAVLSYNSVSKCYKKQKSEGNSGN